MRGTRAWILAKGVAIIGIVYMFFYVTGMAVLQYILQSLFSVFMVAIVIMVQPELQKLVEKIGTNNIRSVISQFKKKKEEGRFYSEKTIEETLQACENMSKTKTGALIVFERKIPLTEYISSGIEVKGKISNQLLLNTFEKNTPLHDGAVIIREDKLEAATCYLPLSQSKGIEKSLGTRHRAGIGVSEVTDAVVVIVSEETGAISVCQNSNIYHNLTKTDLYNILEEQSIKTVQVTYQKKQRKSLSSWTCFAIAFFSIAIWSIIININDPVISKIIYNVPVEVLNENVLEEIDQVYEIVQGSTVNVKVTAHRSIIDKIKNDDIMATADFTEMSKVYAVPIQTNLVDKSINAELSIDSNAIMKLQLEDVIQSEIAVSVTPTGKVAEGYYFNKAAPVIPSIIVSGPKSIMNTIGKAETVVDITGKNKATTLMSKIILYDKNGSVINSDNVTLNETETEIKIDIYKTKSLKVVPELTDNKNYKINTYHVNDIIVAADDKTLSSLSSLSISIDPKQIDISHDKILIDLNLYLPKNVFLPSSQSETIEISFSISEIKPKKTKATTPTE
jgi:diadenylate cyclase